MQGQKLSHKHRGGITEEEEEMETWIRRERNYKDTKTLVRERAVA